MCHGTCSTCSTVALDFKKTTTIYYCSGIVRVVPNKELILWVHNPLNRKGEIMRNSTTVSINGVNIIIFSKGTIFIPTIMLVGKGDLSVQWATGQNYWIIQPIPLVKGEVGSKYLLEPTGYESEVFTHQGGFISKVRELDTNYNTATGVTSDVVWVGIKGGKRIPIPVS